MQSGAPSSRFFLARGWDTSNLLARKRRPAPPQVVARKRRLAPPQVVARKRRLAPPQVVARKRRLAPPQELADNFPLCRYNRDIG